MAKITVMRPAPPYVAGDEANDEADRHGAGGDGDADDQRHPRAVDHAAIDVAAQAVGAHEDDTLGGGAVVEAEGDLGAGLLVARRRIDARRIHRAEDRRQDGDGQHDQQDDAAENDGRVAESQSPQAPAFGRGRRDGGGVDDFLVCNRAQ
jgi:hypothetical protein